MLVSLSQVLKKAQRGKYAVGAFNINNLEMLEGIIKAAQDLRSPVIIQTSEAAILYAGLHYLVAMIKVAAKTPVPVVMHLDHGKDLDIIRECVRAGYSSVMFDGSALPFEENLRHTRQVVKFAHNKGVDVEAEIGAIGGMEDFVNIKEQETHLTDPNQADVFAKKSQCDALAIAIGTSHGAYKFKRDPYLDFQRLSEIRRRVKIPLVLHGASSVPKDLVKNLNKHHRRLCQQARLEGAQGVSSTLIKNSIQLGICKINVDTDLRIAFTGAVLNTLIEQPKIIDPRQYLMSARLLIEEVVKRKIRLFGSLRKA